MPQDSVIIDAIVPYYIKGVKKRGRKVSSFYVRDTIPLEIPIAQSQEIRDALEYEHLSGGGTKYRKPLALDGDLYRPLYLPNRAGLASLEAFRALAAEPIHYEWIDSPFGKTLNSHKFPLSKIPTYDDFVLGMKEITDDYGDIGKSKAARSALRLRIIDGVVHTRINEPMWRAGFSYGEPVVSLVERRSANVAEGAVFFRADEHENAKDFARRLALLPEPNARLGPVRGVGRIKAKHPDYAYKSSSVSETLTAEFWSLTKLYKGIVKKGTYGVASNGYDDDIGVYGCDDKDRETAAGQLEIARPILSALLDGEPGSAERALGFLQDAGHAFDHDGVTARITREIAPILFAAQEWDLAAIAAPCPDDDMFDTLSF